MTMQIQFPFPTEALQEQFKLQGQVRPEMEENIIPVTIVADQSHAAFPISLIHCSATCDRTTAAGQNFFATLACTDPNTIAVIRRVIFDSSAADFLDVSFGDLALGGTATVSRLVTDQRVRRKLRSLPAYTLTHNSVAGGPVTGMNRHWRSGAPGGHLDFEPKGWVIQGAQVPSLSSGITFCNEVVGPQTSHLELEWDEFSIP